MRHATRKHVQRRGRNFGEGALEARKTCRHFCCDLSTVLVSLFCVSLSILLSRLLSTILSTLSTIFVDFDDYVVAVKHVAPGLRPGPRGCTGHLAGAWEVSPQKTPLLKGTRGSKGFFRRSKKQQQQQHIVLLSTFIKRSSRSPS